MARWVIRTAGRRPQDEEQSSAWFPILIAPSLQNPVERIAHGGTVGGQWSIPRGRGEAEGGLKETQPWRQNGMH